MKDILIFIGSMLLYAIAVFIVYSLLRKFVLSKIKIKINRWIIFILALVVFIVTPILFPNMPATVANYVVSGVVVILFLWFMDLSGFMKKSESKAVKASYSKSINASKNKKDNIVIRPKAKPNRVKQSSINKK